MFQFDQSRIFGIYFHEIINCKVRIRFAHFLIQAHLFKWNCFLPLDARRSLQLKKAEKHSKLNLDEIVCESGNKKKFDRMCRKGRWTHPREMFCWNILTIWAKFNVWKQTAHTNLKCLNKILQWSWSHAFAFNSLFLSFFLIPRAQNAKIKNSFDISRIKIDKLVGQFALLFSEWE